MHVEIAGTAGFCFGVRNAIRKAGEAALKAEGPVYTYGPLIHNVQALGDLEKQGVYALKEGQSVPEGGTVVIRAHGISREEEDYLKSLNITLLDATCPFVKKIHRLVQGAEEETRVIIFGDRNHPEVKGIRGWCREEPLIFKDPQELKTALESENCLKGPFLVVAQTTFDRYRFENMVDMLQQRTAGIKVCNTICEATMQHQQEAVEIARRSDVMVVLGGRSSSNTAKLVELCRQHCPQTVFAETGADLPGDLLEGLGEKTRVGITAGASTPDQVIREAAERIQSCIKGDKA
ncbi:MAG: 4-hydroxy-3-methylbut-2-enyl diphosphate reductase [Lachnospiraceae bacterium]|nr:4-hydroxy-3-methylbut-2-enyl diphosphate reductase [Lachnospiraceae bacterium]